MLFPKQIITLVIESYYVIPKTATDMSPCQLYKSKRRNNSSFQVNFLLFSHFSTLEKMYRCTIRVENFPMISNLSIVWSKKNLKKNYNQIFCHVVPDRHCWSPLSSSSLIFRRLSLLAVIIKCPLTMLSCRSRFSSDHVQSPTTFDF